MADADARSLVVSLLTSTGAARRVADAGDADEQLEIEAKASGGIAQSLYARLKEKEPAREARSRLAATAACSESPPTPEARIPGAVTDPGNFGAAGENVQLTATGAALDIVAGCFRNFAPPPDQPVSAWAAENRVPSRKDSARPGPWKPEPHQPAITDAMTDPSVRRVVLTGCSQFTGKS